jgi:ABC-type glycerol-3-phosphate transport system substrate-binding protein
LIRKLDFLWKLDRLSSDTKTKKMGLRFLVSLLLISSMVGLSACEKKENQALVPFGENLKLQIWAAGEADFLQELGTAFKSAAQTANLSVHVVPFASDEELQDFLLEAMAAGEGPDVIYTDGNWIHENLDKLTPVTNEPAFTPEAYEKTFVKAANELFLKDGNIWGVPLAVDSLAILYNEEHLIDYLKDRNEPAKTWDQFQKDVEILNRLDNSFARFSLSGGALGRVDNLNYGVEILENLMFQGGVPFFSPDGTESGLAREVMLNGERQSPGLLALNFFTSFANPVFKNFSWSQFLANPESLDKDFETFAKGKVSMVFGFSKDYNRLRDLILKLRQAGDTNVSEKNLRVALLPQLLDPKAREVVAYVRGLAVPRTSENATIAWKFLKFVIRKENLSEFHAFTDLPTPRLDLLSEQESAPHLGLFVRQAKFARPNIMPLSERTFQSGLGGLVNRINEGSIPSSVGLTQLQESFTQEIRDQINRERLLESFKTAPVPNQDES